jgi:hypothetical protein
MKPYPNFRDVERLSGMTWGDLTTLEPRLEELLWAARHASVTCHQWSDVDRVFAPIRNALADLIGFAGKHHRHLVLGSVGAFQVAYWRLYDSVAGLLPSHAGCVEETLEKQGQPIVAESWSARKAASAHSANSGIATRRAG